MKSFPESSLVIVNNDRLPPFFMLGLVLAAGWLVGMAARSSSRTSSGASADIGGSPTTTKGWKDKKDNFFGGVKAFSFATDVQTAGALKTLSDLQNEINKAAQAAFQNTIAAAAAKNSSDLYQAALNINLTASAFNDVISAYGAKLSRDTIKQLNGLAQELKSTASAIPEATDKLNAVNAFLSVFSKILTLFG